MSSQSHWVRSQIKETRHLQHSARAYHALRPHHTQPSPKNCYSQECTMVSRVPFVHGTIPRPSAFTVRLSHGLEMQLCVGQQAADKLSSRSVRRTEAIVAKRRSVRFTCSTSKGSGVRHTIHRQEIMLQCTTYCNKEHSHQNTCSLYTSGNLGDTGSLELPPWNPPASWSLPWAFTRAQ